MNGLQDRYIFTHDFLFQIQSKVEKGRILGVCPVSSESSNDHIGLCLSWARQTKRRDEAKPAAIKHAALIKDGRAIDSDTIGDWFTIGVLSFEIVEHRVIGPLNLLIGIFLVKGNVV